MINEKTCKKDKMFINISVVSYLKELTLMEEQYGQEEDMYPWIYMLLQMAECHKKSKAHISIRDVHKAQSALGLKEKRERLKGKTSFPDFVIFKGESNDIVGCVEIKKREGNKRLIPKEREMGYELEKKLYKTYYFNIGVQHQRRYVKDEQIEISETQYKNWNEDMLKEFTGSFDGKNIQKNEFGKDAKTYKKEWQWTFKSEISKVFENIERPWEIVGHLERFKNVLFTNGLEFYYLQLKEDENNKSRIFIKELADLTEIYNKYKSNLKSTKLLKELTGNDSEWEKLVCGLVELEWYK